MTRVPRVMPRFMLAALVVGLVIRLAIWTQTTDLAPKIADEQDYVALATSLVEGRGYAWATGERTSLRPPLYPALVAGTWTLAGKGNLQAVRALQIVLSLATAMVVFELGRRGFSPSTGAFASAVVWLYPDFIFLNSLLLTETLFTLLLVSFALCAVILLQRPRASIALSCGIVLGLATLTRSVLWPMPILLCPALVFMLKGDVKRRLLLPAIVVAGFAVVVGPWAVRNTRLQGVVTVVDTMGGMNLRMGNYEYTPEDRMWDAVSIRGERSWVHALSADQVAGRVPPVVTEGVKDKWAQRKALEYMLANPVTTIRRSVIKFGDFWGLERSFLAGVQQGLYHPPAWFAVTASGLMLLSYAGLSLAGVAGIWLARPACAVHAMLLLPMLLITGIHSIVFGHARYHLPLVPLLALYASALREHGVRRAFQRATWARSGALASMFLLIAFWTRQVLIVDAPRIRAVLGGWW